ncbi:MAG: cytochrome [Bacteriovoracaceae bacterium]|nr:cytochrome [Bacteriovoracaceae bacterium]
MGIRFKCDPVFGYYAFGLIFLLSLIGCKPTEDKEFAEKSTEQISSIKKGKAIYQSICIACHNSNPKLDGALGPAVAGSSQELLEARILSAKYPPGYKPKRPTALMVALPQYKDAIPAIYDYLEFTNH